MKPVSVLVSEPVTEKTKVKKMKITIDEIAELAQVSKTTVSRVINNKPDVSEETRKKVLDVVSKYDFQPNAYAKAISLNKSNTIGLIIPYEADFIFSNPFYVEVMRGVSSEVNKRGYYLLICYPHDHNYVDIFKQKRVDGFILLSPGKLHKNIIDSLNEVNAPFVSTSKLSDEDGLIYVDVNNYYGAQLAIEHLISLGHTKIGFIGKPTLTSASDRLEGYKAVLEKNGLPYDENLIKISDDSSIEGAYKKMCELLRSHVKPTAVFLASDLMAIGAIKAIDEMGLKTPEDISIVGFDDIPLAKYMDPELTTVRQPSFEKGVQAARLLIQYLEKKKKPRSKILNVELIVRKSTSS